MQAGLTAALLGVLGLVCLYLAGNDSPWWNKSFQGVIRDLGSLLVVSVVLGLIWELLGKRSFAREILETARTSADYETSGLARVGTNYLEDPDWEDLFRNVEQLDINVEQLDIFVAYASTWRNLHLNRLHVLASRPVVRYGSFYPIPRTTTPLPLSRDASATRMRTSVAASRRLLSLLSQCAAMVAQRLRFSIDPEIASSASTDLTLGLLLTRNWPTGHIVVSVG